MKQQKQGETRVRALLELLDLERVDTNLFLGSNESRGQYRLFGGQVLSQALRAAYVSVADRRVHSLHGYFLRAGTAARKVLYQVDQIRDGGSFCTRRVVARQNGEAIFTMSASFHKQEQGFEHALAMPNVPGPQELEDDSVVAGLMADDERLSAGAVRIRPFEMRSVFPFGSPGFRADRTWNPVWIRFRDRTPVADPQLAHALLAYASDMGMVSTASLPHQQAVPRSRLQMASLDHALWFHRPFDINDWLLFHKRTSMAHGSRGLVHAEFFSRDGELIASVTQEGLVRLRDAASGSK
ncbi:MAG: acyl-CoA thioesterase II [Proteobacteria bacterium]|nr:acyl-CoA thioesterase II [Pseudomonadota bacterium]